MAVPTAGTIPEVMRERYIGDGVYASYDGSQIWLRTERDGQQHTIALEIEVLRELNTYAKLIADVRKALQPRRD